ncbi:uncharacterized protein MELLADRAFT_64230 [Melampsora larici-populina 98AG31]|uniref:Uncharacterized protein n=1 Tax=Melampsora larici-populina (strain 98AG31 / pathotype 3-4-7) TaxID=747676 RepID=F4RQN2_MELLP|nr:uncharacterized protein MELLADRAFT_64230 [Melampsora larici-populina 98AG31]EGG05070.1 hypothetical protein MELLADRAFT_64230 [Melampsora larici-populina 98AG31]
MLSPSVWWSKPNGFNGRRRKDNPLNEMKNTIKSVPTVRCHNVETAMSYREGYVECSSSSMVNRVSSVSLEADVNCSGRGSSSGAITSSTSDVNCTGRGSPSENITSSTATKVKSFYCSPENDFSKGGRIRDKIITGPFKGIRMEEEYRAVNEGQNPIPLTFALPPIKPNTVYCAAPSKVAKSDEMVVPLIPKGLTTLGRIGKFCDASQSEESDSQEPEDSILGGSARIPNIGSTNSQSSELDFVQFIGSSTGSSKSDGSNFVAFIDSSDEQLSSTHSNDDGEKPVSENSVESSVPSLQAAPLGCFASRRKQINAVNDSERCVTPVDQQERLPSNLLPFTNSVTDARLTPQAIRTYNWLRECNIIFGKGSNQIKAQSMLKDSVLFGIHNVTSDITQVDIWTFLKARLDVAQIEKVRAVLKVRQPFKRLRYNVWVSPDLATDSRFLD